MSRTTQEQLVHFLSDMYSVEQQALAQLVKAPDVAGDPSIASDFSQHHVETQQQAELVRERLEAHGGSPSKIKDAIMRLGGKGQLLFARVMPESPGRLVDHSYAYEAMEWAGYEMLMRFAERAGDGQTVQTAKVIRDEERTMMDRLEHDFDAAEQASHRDTPADDIADHVTKHLSEVHSFERQGVTLLRKSDDIGGNDLLDSLYADLLEQTQKHSQHVEERLEALGTGNSTLTDKAMELGGLNWGLFFQAQSDTPAKLAAFVYAFLHLQIGGYELLQRTCRRAGDALTERLCAQHISEKRSMAERVANAFDSAVDATLA